MDYALTQQKERFGAIELTFTCLESLDATIDRIFEVLSREGRGELLKELCPYFGCIWPAARVLTRALLEAGEARLMGRSLLELGCGLAMPSFVAARLGAQVTATDCHPDVPEFLAINMRQNGEESLRYVE